MVSILLAFPPVTYIRSSSPPYSRGSGWLLAGRQRGRILSPGRVKNFHFSVSSRQPLAVDGPRVKRQEREIDCSNPNCAERSRKRGSHIPGRHILPPLRLNGVVLS
jgi:hypothetical protein